MRTHLGTPEERCRCHPAPPFPLTSAERDQQQEPEGPDPDTEPRREGPLPRTALASLQAVDEVALSVSVNCFTLTALQSKYTHQTAQMSWNPVYW
ncbi:hypothetical protein CRENBAI_026630 [Crenichthys baileyi]|uniref:Uncharacterized protein n=1 Tax=Crenichthys baileyi TaxID=28760 RepID=A0AAV9R5S4_9TELE